MGTIESPNEAVHGNMRTIDSRSEDQGGKQRSLQEIGNWKTSWRWKGQSKDAGVIVIFGFGEVLKVSVTACPALHKGSRSE